MPDAVAALPRSRTPDYYAAAAPAPATKNDARDRFVGGVARARGIGLASTPGGGYGPDPREIASATLASADDKSKPAVTAVTATATSAPAVASR